MIFRDKRLSRKSYKIHRESNILPDTIIMFIPIRRMKYYTDYHLHSSEYHTNGNPYNIHVRLTICIVLDTIDIVACTIFYSKNRYEHLDSKFLTYYILLFA